MGTAWRGVAGQPRWWRGLENRLAGWRVPRITPRHGRRTGWGEAPAGAERKKPPVPASRL